MAMRLAFIAGAPSWSSNERSTDGSTRSRAVCSNSANDCGWSGSPPKSLFGQVTPRFATKPGIHQEEQRVPLEQEIDVAAPLVAVLFLQMNDGVDRQVGALPASSVRAEGPIDVFDVGEGALV